MPFLLVPEEALALSATAAAVLDLVDGERPLTEIKTQLAAQFDADPGTVGRDVDALIADLIEAGHVAAQPATRKPSSSVAASVGRTTAEKNPAATSAKPGEPPSVGPPIAMLAELTHRCPLRCLYCSNPLELTRRSAELDTAAWARVFKEAAALGVLQVHISGGEPAARKDLVEIVASASRAGLYTNLITSGLGLSTATLDACARDGLDHVQLSLQALDQASAATITGHQDPLPAKARVARETVALGLPLTLNTVIHRENISDVAGLINLARDWQAERIEIAHTQYHGWAALNRKHLLPSLEEISAASDAVDAARRVHGGSMRIDHVKPDHFATYPKACMGGWARTGLVVVPDGIILPCHSAGTLPGLVFPNVKDTSLEAAWTTSHAFNAYRGTEWMKPPCRGCPRAEVDFGGCRCQAFAVTGDAAATDPACSKSPVRLPGPVAARPSASDKSSQAGRYRGFATQTEDA
ncbi:MAG: pyrroloquinoline quinone biosynthesis protein PqqE [Pseudomonadota bacterium]